MPSIANEELERLKGSSGSKEQLSLDNFLEGLVDCLYNERVNLTIGCLSSHRFCQKAPEGTREEVVSEVELMFPSEAMIGKDQLRLPYFVGDVFMQAVESEVAAKQGSSRGSGGAELSSKAILYLSTMSSSKLPIVCSPRFRVDVVVRLAN
jgi:hypothetical protein